MNPDNRQRTTDNGQQTTGNGQQTTDIRHQTSDNGQQITDNRHQKGIALFMTLWVLTLMSVIVGEFCHTMRTETNITRNFKEDTEAYYIALAGVNTAIAELIKNEIMKPPDIVKSPEASEIEEEDKIEWRINADIPAVPFDKGYFKVKIGNESGKININNANRGMLKMMLNRFELEENDKDMIIDSILDWRDKDSLHRLNGAEDDYYRSLPEPYECKDGDFDSVEEILLVKGITQEMFYGGLSEMLTVLQTGISASKKGTQGGKKKGSDSSRININAADPELLLSLPQMTEELVMEIMAYREEEGDIKKLDELINLLGMDVYNAVLPYITLTKSSVFTIRSVGMIEGSHTRQGIEIVVEVDPKLEDKYQVLKWVDR